jgi:hypothetical protein
VGRLPAEVTGGFGVLLYFSVVGVMVPIVVLAVQPESIHWLVRIAILALFASGLAWLCSYVFQGINKVDGRREATMVEEDAEIRSALQT